MLETNRQAEAEAELAAGRPVLCHGVEVPAPPESERTRRKARAYLKEYLEQHGAAVRGRPPLEGLDRVRRPRLTDDQVAALDELATRWRCSRDEAARRVVDAGIEAVRRRDDTTPGD